jgi:hypothetical protein
VPQPVVTSPAALAARPPGPMSSQRSRPSGREATPIDLFEAAFINYKHGRQLLFPGE